MNITVSESFNCRIIGIAQSYIAVSTMPEKYLNNVYKTIVIHILIYYINEYTSLKEGTSILVNLKVNLLLLEKI